MIIEGTHRPVTLEYSVLCARCQGEIPAGEMHDLTNAQESGRTVYLHRHNDCPKHEPAKPKDPAIEDGEALAMMGATFLVAGASYLLGRWRQQKARRTT